VRFTIGTFHASRVMSARNWSVTPRDGRRGTMPRRTAQAGIDASGGCRPRVDVSLRVVWFTEGRPDSQSHATCECTPVESPGRRLHARLVARHARRLREFRVSAPSSDQVAARLLPGQRLAHSVPRIRIIELAVR
jgi:hypothetical protein